MSEQTKKDKKKKKPGLLSRLKDRTDKTNKAITDLNKQFNSNF